jgi:hypothetical protein
MSLVYCPKCESTLEDGECLAPNSVDESVPCKVCYDCDEAFTEDFDGWDVFEELNGGWDMYEAMNESEVAKDVE